MPALTLIMLAFPASSLASANPPSITSAFTPNSIGTGDTSALSYTIVNPNTSGLTGVGFTDQLPAGVVVDNPNGSSVGKSCGASATLTADPAASTITLSGASLKAARTDSATVTSGSGTVTDSTVAASDQGTLVTGQGIPAGTYVGTVTPGASFLLSSSPTVQVNVTATDNGTSVTIEPTCTVSAAVTSTTTGVYQNSTGPVTSNEGGSGTSDTESLTVINPPSVTITAPINGATFTYGQKVIAQYSCQEATNPAGPGLADCEGDVPNGSAIDTTTPGQNTFTVTAISADGEVTDQTVAYTVLPNNAFTVSNIYPPASGRVSFDARLPGPGKIVSAEQAVIKGSSNQQPVPFGADTLGAPKAGSTAVIVYLTAQGRALLRRVRRANHSARPKHEVIQLTLTITYTPRGGKAKSVTHELKITP